MTEDVVRDLLLYEIKRRPTQQQYEFLASLPVFGINGCGRQMVIGTKNELAGLPGEITQHWTRHDGVDAYQRNLQFISGLLSKTRGEAQIVDQYKGGWKRYVERFPERAAYLSPFFESLKADNALIRSRVTPGLKPAYYESAARAEMGEAAGARTLLVMEADPLGDGRPDDLTRIMLRQMTNNRGDRVGTLVLTHPDSNVLNRIFPWVAREHSQGRLHADIERRRFKDAIDSEKGLKDVTHLVVTYPMGENEDVDRKLIEEWGQREVFGGKLIHLGNREKEERVSKGLWISPNLSRYVSPEDIRARQAALKSTNDAIAAQAAETCRNCAVSRSHGKRPIGNMLHLPPEIYRERSGIDRGGRSIAG